MFHPHSPPHGAVLLLRGTAVLGALLVGSAAVGRLALPHLTAPAHTFRAAEPARLPELVAAGCAAALVVCWVWVLLGAAHALVTACRGRIASSSRRWPPRAARAGWAPGPRAVRVLVGALLGLGYAAPPALAGGPADPACTHRATTADLSGLSLPQLPATPDRGAPTGPPAAKSPTGPPAATAPAQRPVRWVRLRAGDSLWAVAERLLPPTASDREVDRGWRRIARANARVVGADPDLVFPGTVLRVPVPLTADGKDRP